VDREFGNTLDGLMVVDLIQTNRKMLKRYMGMERLEAFLDYHSNIGNQIFYIV
jgi:hypothetical protein